MVCLYGERLYRIGLDGRSAEVLLVGEYGRLRTVARAPDGSVRVVTSNHDGGGAPMRDDDRILRLPYSRTQWTIAGVPRGSAAAEVAPATQIVNMPAYCAGEHEPGPVG